MSEPHHVVIIGGGFGGLSAAKALKKAPVRVTLVDRRNFHLFQPLLYQVAMGGLSPANIAAPLRAILKNHANTRVLLGEVVDFDLEKRRVVLKDGELSYDSLIVAAGARHHYFGNPQWEQLAPGLKTIEDATELRRRVLVAFERAERETDPARQQAWMTFVVVGGGATGVELAGALGELAQYTLRRNFRAIDPARTKILLVEGSDRVLPPFVPKLSGKAEQALVRLGVTVRTRTVVADIQPHAVTLKYDGHSELVPTQTVLWAAGVQGSPLNRLLAKSPGVTLDRADRVVIQPDLTLPGHPEVFIIGDQANYSHQDGKPLPGVAQVAIQQGRHASLSIQRRLAGKDPLPPFAYRDLGSMATIGRAAAVVDLGWIRFSGFFAWLTWLFVHLMAMVNYGSRVMVFGQFAANYVTRNRSARLITGEGKAP